MGGVKITSVESKKQSETFVYTCGFTDVGGKELLMENVPHRSWGSSVAHLLNYTCKRHKQGHPLGNGHTISGENGVNFFVRAPNTETEATLLKATKTVEPTHLYGLDGYDILIIRAVGVRSSSQKEKGGEASAYASREEALIQSLGINTDGYQSLVKSTVVPTANAAPKPRMCGWCHSTAIELGEPLLLCKGCNNALYCSRQCQKQDWKKSHKVECRRSKQELIDDFMSLDPVVTPEK